MAQQLRKRSQITVRDYEEYGNILTSVVDTLSFGGGGVKVF